jgi:hypothetical protein
MVMESKNNGKKGWHRMMKYIKSFMREKEIHGIEFAFNFALMILRLSSASYWLRSCLPSPKGSDHKLRDNAVDIYCIFQFFVLLILFLNRFSTIFNIIIVIYILFEIYLNLFNIVFIGKIKKINAPPSSVERSILLLMLNVIDVVLAFSILYRDWLDLSKQEAIFQSVLVLGTVGHPSSQSTEIYMLLVMLQIFLNILLVLLFLSSFIGQIGLFRKSGHNHP